MNTKLKVEIWSDMVCPFCYIGKKNFNDALQNFEHKNEVEIVWRSFYLNKELDTKPGETVKESLASSKGWSEAEVEQATNYTTKMAADSGLKFDFSKAIAANSAKAHELAHFAASRNLADKVYESVFSAYFTEGKNINDKNTLLNIANDIGLDKKETEEVLSKDVFAPAVDFDYYQAQNLGITGVPFFLFNEKYAVSGAQPTSVFHSILNDTWSKMQNEV